LAAVSVVQHKAATVKVSRMIATNPLRRPAAVIVFGPAMLLRLSLGAGTPFNKFFGQNHG